MTFNILANCDLTIANMELKGKIIKLLPLQTGTGKNGTWKKQEYILQTEEQFPKKICFVVWGEKIDEYSLKEGDGVTASVDIESREFNGRWYTDVKAWKVERAQGDDSKVTTEINEGDDIGASHEESPDDLPF